MIRRELRAGRVGRRWVALRAAVGGSPAAASFALEGLEHRTLFSANVLINEIMYNPGSAGPNQTADEWIELFNAGDQAADLSGWRISKGMDYTFAAETSIPAGGFLVVAADVGRFEEKYGAGRPVVGGWVGQLSNSTEEVEIEDAAGNDVDSVTYADDGEWARRARPSGTRSVASLVREGTTVTATVPGHGFANGDRVDIVGAVETGFNGTFTIANATEDSFTYTVSGTPASPATGGVSATKLKVVESLVRGGGLATAVVPGHQFDEGDLVTISGSTTGAFNGTVIIYHVTPDTFSYVLAGAAATAEGPIRVLKKDQGHQGWDWQQLADGQGHSLELRNPSLTNNLGQNWMWSVGRDGTPGEANSRLEGDSAPLIRDLTHFPVAPKSNESVRITARVTDEAAGGPQSVTLNWRVDALSPNLWQQVEMFDDGSNGDAVAGDGVFSAVVPPQANNRVIEYYVTASDGALTRSLPGDTDGFGTHNANALYQVDDAVLAATQPVFKFILTEAERRQLVAVGSSDAQSDAQMTGTVIAIEPTGTHVIHQASFRNRGRGSRSQTPNNYRVNLPNQDALHGRTGLVFNARYSSNDLIGSAIFQVGGVSGQDAVPVQIRVNNADLSLSGTPTAMFGSYTLVEAEDDAFVEAHFPTDAGGNLYRGFDGLVDRGTNPDAYRMTTNHTGYQKQTNAEADDWSDLIHLVQVLNPAGGAGGVLDPAAVREAIDVEQWMRYFAINELIGNGENSLGIGVGDDYTMYRGTVDTRFKLSVHDLDTLFGIGESQPAPPVATAPIFRATQLPPLNRLLKHPEFAPIYYAQLKDLAENVFVASVIDPLIDRVLDYAPAGTRTTMKQYAAARRAHILSLIPGLSTATAIAVSNGYPTTTNATGTITGTFDPIRTKTVMVNGVAVPVLAGSANWSATVNGASVWEGKFTATGVALRPGLNRVLVQALDESGVEISRTYLDIHRNSATPTNISGTLPAGTTTLTAEVGVYRVASTLTVPAGATLVIEAGVTVWFEGGANLVVNGGRLSAVGTDLQRIRFGKLPGAATAMGNIQFANTMLNNQLVYADIETGTGDRIDISAAHANIDHFYWIVPSNTTTKLLDMTNASFSLTNSIIPQVGATEPIHFAGNIPAQGMALMRGNYFFGNAGFNDEIDFTGGQRPGPILTLIDNVFAGPYEDDILDLDGTDAYIEGNVFMNAHLVDVNNPDTSSAVSGGLNGSDISEWTLVRNYFYNLDHAVLAKEGAFVKMVNNTIANVRVAAINFDEPGRSGIVPGKGAMLDGNIIWNTPLVFENVNSDGTTTQITVSRSILPGAGVYPGVGNSNVDPHLVQSSGAMADPRVGLKLRPGFGPARGTGPNGADMGADIPNGTTVGGAPMGTTSSRNATLTVGGPHLVSYLYRVNDGGWLGEFPIGQPIQLSGLADGTYTVYVAARDDRGVLQPLAEAAASKTWAVDGAYVPSVVINEILANNVNVVVPGGGTPDLIELYNPRATELDLSGMSITDDVALPRKHVFPAGTVIPAGGYLVLRADVAGLGFALSEDGEGVFIYESEANGGGVVDSVVFGKQLDDLSISRRADGTYGLGTPTLGGANALLRMGDTGRLSINEWLGDGVAPFTADFIEMKNGSPLPVDLGGMWVSDNPNGWADRYVVPPLTFVAGGGYFVFKADDDAGQGADHLPFKLSPLTGMISIADSGGAAIDTVLYLTQRPGVSQGRPAGTAAGIIQAFTQPSPGLANPGTVVVPTEPVNLFAWNATGWKYNNTSAFTDSAWAGRTFDDTSATAWPTGQAGFWNQASDVFPAAVPKTTNLGTTNRSTYYFRKHFTIEDPALIVSMSFMIAHDDGSVIYVNGQEVRRIAMPNGQPVYTTASNRATGWETAIEGSFPIDPALLVAGDNVIAVEVHQASNNDAGFALMLDAVRVASGAAVPALRITEINYNPVGGTVHANNAYEFIEVMNVGATPLSLDGFEFTGGVLGALNNVTLQPGERGVVVKDLAAFTERYGPGIRVVGTFGDSLDDTGEVIRLEKGGTFVHDFAYSDGWQPATDGAGGTLVILDAGGPRGAWGTAAAWASSASIHGTPGMGESELAAGGMFVNEVLAGATTAGGDFVELRNTTASDVDISGWWLSDSADDLTKFRVPAGTTVPAFGYLALFGGATFDLPAGGGEVYLSSADGEGVLTSYRSGRRFGPSAAGVSFGPHLRTTGETVFVALQTPTPNGLNAAAKVGPVIVSEIMYNPDGGRDEFIELRNISGAAVSLAGWSFTNGAMNDDGTPFAFPAGSSLAAGAHALMVGIDPAVFRSKYNVPSYVQVFQVMQADGKFLSNGGETIELSAAGGVVVDRVEFTDAAPWPAAADGNGSSLARLSPALFGDDAGNWGAEADGGSPGYENFDVAAPTGGIVDVSSDPRASGVGSIVLSFSEPVVLGMGDLALSRNGGANLLGTGQTLTTEDGVTWTLSGLDALTFAQGSYVLMMSTAVADLSGNSVGGDSDSFTVTVTSIQGTTGADRYYVRVDEGNLEVFLADGPVGQPRYVVPVASIDSLVIDAGGGDDALTIGTALPFNPVFKGGAGINEMHVNAGTVDFANDASVDSGQLRLFVTDAVVRFATKQRLALLVATGTSARVEVAAGGTNHLFAQELLLGGGTIDLADNDLIVGQGTTAAEMRGRVNLGQIRGIAQRGGFAMTFAPIDNSLICQAQWEGVALGPTFGQVIVKHAYAGDANLDDIVSEADYGPVTAGMGRPNGQWVTGDVTNDGVVNSSDFARVTANLGAGTGSGGFAPLLVRRPQGPGLTTPSTSTSKLLAGKTAVKPLPAVHVVKKAVKAVKAVAKRLKR